MTRRRGIEGETRPPTQLERVREVLLMAARLDLWMTLKELAGKTRYPEASISAQLRHLRKPERGGYVVEKRRREAEESLKENTHERVWEYQMRRGEWSFLADEAGAGGRGEAAGRVISEAMK